MAILFYEGLPGAGKSYEAMATQIIPFLQKGREVVAYIEGLDHERIAEAAGMDVERVRELLHVLDREDMRPREVGGDRGRTVAVDGLWIEKIRDNAFHVFDEAQNWWPNKLKATEALTQFVSEHRHRGMDVLLMGQSLKDVLALWRRRVDQKFTFLKLTALGSDKRYRVTVYKGQGNDEFVKVTDKVGKYDPKYFGTYKSHVSDDTNTVTYTDKRANFLLQWARWAIPLCIGLVLWGGWKSWAFFHPPVPVVASKVGPVSPPAGAVSASPAVTKADPAKAVPDLRSPQEKHFADLGGKYRIRLAGLLQGRSHVDGVVEWLDGGTRVVERLSLDQLRELGVAVLLIRDTVRLSVGDWVELATMWPVEADGRVSENRIAAMRPRPDDAGLPASQGGVSVAASGSGLPAGLTIIQDAKSTPDVVPPVEQQPQRVGSFRRS